MNTDKSLWPVRVITLILYTLFLSMYLHAEERLTKHGVPFSWPVSVDRVPVIDKTVLGSFLGDLLNDGNYPEGTPTEIESYQFAKLDSGDPFLIAVFGMPGRPIFNAIAVARCTGVHCAVEQLDSEEPNELDALLADADGDGYLEIITQSYALWDGGASLPVYVFSIHKWRDGKLVDVTNACADYYKVNLLERDPRNERKDWLRAIADPKQSPQQNSPNQILEPAADELTLFEAEDKFRVDYYNRRVLGKKDAGLDHTLEWVASQNQKLLELAIRSFGEINSPQAAMELQKLAGSDNEYVRNQARDALYRKGLINQQDRR